MRDYIGHVRINGEPYRVSLELATSHLRDVSDFSPRATVPGGGAIYSKLDTYQLIQQSDWRHGFGHTYHTDEMGYMETAGLIDTRHPAIALMYTNPTLSDSDNYEKVGLTRFGSDIYSWGEHGLRKFNGTTWSDVYTTGAVNFALNTGKYLFFCPDGARIRKIDTAGSETEAGKNANSTDFKWMTMHDGYIFAGKDQQTGNTKGNLIFYDGNADLSELYGLDSETEQEIIVGIEGIAVKGAESFLGDLICFRNDSIYRIDDDLQTARKIIDYSDLTSSLNFKSWEIHNGYLMYSVRDQIIQWNGVRQNIREPNRLNDSFPYRTYGSFNNFTTVGKYMYLTGKTNDATYQEHILCFDGAWYTKLVEPITDGDGSITAMWFDPTANRLWYHVSKAASNATYYIQFQSNSDYPYASFPTTGTHYLYTSKYDAGFRLIQKSTPSILIDASNISSGHYYLKVFYSLNGGTWKAWGGTDGTTNVITANGLTTLSNPLGAASGFSTVEYSTMQIRIQFITDNASYTPVLKNLMIKLMLRPETVYGLSYDLIFSRNELDANGIVDNRSTKEMIDDLKTARDSVAPISFIDLDGVEHIGYLTSIDGRFMNYNPSEPGAYPEIERKVRINFIGLQ